MGIVETFDLKKMDSETGRGTPENSMERMIGTMEKLGADEMKLEWKTGNKEYVVSIQVKGE